jgi:ribosome-associated protein
MPIVSAAEKARLGARAALGKKAEDVAILDLKGISGVTDFFLLCSGRSTAQIQTIADAVEGQLKGEGIRPFHREGLPESGWLLMDYGDVVMHVFLGETRRFYALERLWGDAPLLSVER